MGYDSDGCGSLFGGLLPERRSSSEQSATSTNQTTSIGRADANGRFVDTPPRSAPDSPGKRNQRGRYVGDDIRDPGIGRDGRGRFRKRGTSQAAVESEPVGAGFGATGYSSDETVREFSPFVGEKSEQSSLDDLF